MTDNDRSKTPAPEVLDPRVARCIELTARRHARKDHRAWEKAGRPDNFPITFSFKTTVDPKSKHPGPRKSIRKSTPKGNAGRPKRDPLSRVKLRPNPEQWAPDEGMTFVEAAAVFYPSGPLSARSLRTAASKGELAVVSVASKLFTTPTALKDMMTPTKRVTHGMNPMSTADQEAARGRDGKLAQANLLKLLDKLSGKPGERHAAVKAANKPKPLRRGKST